MSRTSRTLAITRPARWGYELVDIFFGQVRPRVRQDVAMSGDLVRRKGAAEPHIYKFVAREDDRIVLEPVQVEDDPT